MIRDFSGINYIFYFKKLRNWQVKEYNDPYQLLICHHHSTADSITISTFPWTINLTSLSVNRNYSLIDTWTLFYTLKPHKNYLYVPTVWIFARYRMRSQNKVNLRRNNNTATGIIINISRKTPPCGAPLIFLLLKYIH